MNGNSKVDGVDYSKGYQPVTRTLSEWRGTLAQELKHGAHRRVEKDDVGPVTYIHGPDWVMRHEIYANVPEPDNTP
jgi:hypothetical protein